MDSGSSPRPIVGASLHLVLLRDPDVEVVSATLRFDRGRGLVVEADEKPPVPFRKGDRVLLVYSAGDGLYAMRGVIAEALTPTRVYILPGSLPVMMEKREYIRAVVPVLSALTIGADAPPADLELAETPVELSASGFRWFGELRTLPGVRAWLSLRLNNGNGARVDLAATVVRAEACGDSFEVAGRFEALVPEVREAILNVVFRRRLAELGIAAGRTWDEDA